MLGTPDIMKEPRLDLLTAIANHAEKIHNETPDRIQMDVWKSESECGTVGCVIGLSIDLPEIKASGLYLHTYVEEQRSGIVVPQMVRCRPAFEYGDCTLYGFMAVAEALGLCNKDAEGLFSGTSYRNEDNEDAGDITGLEVAAKIREFVDGMRAVTDSRAFTSQFPSEWSCPKPQ